MNYNSPSGWLWTPGLVFRLLPVSMTWALGGVGAGSKTQIGRRPPHVLTVTTLSQWQHQGRSRADSLTLIVVDWSGMSVMLIWFSCWLDPYHKTSVFIRLSFISLLADIQSRMTLTHGVNFWTACTASLTVVPMYIWLSSSYWWKHRPCWAITWPSSVVYKTQRAQLGTLRDAEWQLLNRRCQTIVGDLVTNLACN